MGSSLLLSKIAQLVQVKLGLLVVTITGRKKAGSGIFKCGLCRCLNNFMEKQHMQRKLSASMSALLTTITCLILGGSIFALYGTVLRPNTFRTQATTVASHFLTAQVRATLQATTQALASATAFQHLYLRTVSNQPVYSDPLNEQENGDGNASSSPTSEGAFIKGAYHIFESERYLSYYCLSPVGTLIDFAFQVQLTLIKGDEGGIIFGITGTDTNLTNADYFGIDYTGDYSLVNESNQQFKILLHRFNRFINTNSNLANLLTVIDFLRIIDICVIYHLL